MKSLMRMKDEGFTLVELMVVVAIIGVLSAVAIPNFKKYQAKSKTSEAKLQLSAMYTAQQSFYSDYDTYAVCLEFMGYNPVNEVAQRIYVTGFGTGSTIGTGIAAILTANGATGCTNTLAAARSIFPAGKTTGSAAFLTTFTAAEGATTVVDVDSFKMSAVGVVDRLFTTAATASSFSINEAKLLRQERAGY
jgi:type IV pilus assembly protein PilA